MTNDGSPNHPSTHTIVDYPRNKLSINMINDYSAIYTTTRMNNEDPPILSQLRLMVFITKIINHCTYEYNTIVFTYSLHTQSTMAVGGACQSITHPHVPMYPGVITNPLLG